MIIKPCNTMIPNCSWKFNPVMKLNHMEKLNNANFPILLGIVLC